jgi:hypothetical protein
MEVSMSYNKNLVLEVLSAVKLEKAKVGFGYRVIDTDAVGTLEKDMSITECDEFFKKNGIETPPRRKHGDVFFLECEYGMEGLFVYVPVSEDIYNDQMDKFYGEHDEHARVW